MTDPGGDPIDVYSRVDYRRMVAWPERIRREAPFLRKVLRRLPDPSVLDLGCGTGEHTRFLAAEGLRAVGVNRSEAMLEKALERELPANLEFVRADLRELGERLKGEFGGAISLGNTLVHITEEAELRGFLESLAVLLLPGAPFLFQILNYRRIFEQEIRYLPLDFRPDGDREIVFLRLMEHLPGGRVRFCPTTLRYHPDADPPVELVRSKAVELRGWRRAQLEPLLRAAGFEVEAEFGDMQGGAFQAHESSDLVLLSRKR